MASPPPDSEEDATQEALERWEPPLGAGLACGGPAGDVRGKLRQLIRPDVSSTSHEPS